MKLGAVATILALTTAGLAGCLTQDVTVTQNGASITASPAPATDIDACTALTSQILQALGLPNVTPVPIVDKTAPGCGWSGFNDYVTSSVTLWVTSASAADPSNGTVTVAGKKVEVWAISSNSGRYIATCGRYSVTINYTQGKGPLTPHDALALTMEDALAAYHCT